jgi:hypothetical protein
MGKPGMTSSSTSPEPAAGAGAALRGVVHGGESPISGAHIYLYAAGTGGYGGASSSLLKNEANTTSDGTNYYVTSNASGAWSISGDYTCPSSSSQVYLYSIGGSAGGGSSNTAAGLLAGLGNCGSLTSSTYIVINEVSTIATAYAIAGYAVDATDVSSPNNNLATADVENAFAAINNLEQYTDVSFPDFTGSANSTTPAGNGAVPQSEINTLANILAACVNSTSSSASNCTTLFDDAMNGSTAPTDTATAAINIAHNPGTSVSGLYTLQAAAGAPFVPDLSTPPQDYTIAISYKGGGISDPEGVAVDGSGNVWVANFSGSMSGFNNLGAPNSSTAYTGGGLDRSYAIAVDSNENVWVTNQNTTTPSLSEYSTTTSTWISGSSGCTGGGLNDPAAIAIDASDNIWVANSSASTLSEFSACSTPVTSSSGLTGGGLDFPSGLAVDIYGNVWASDSSGSPGAATEYEVYADPAVFHSTFNPDGASDERGIALDGTGLSNTWITNAASGSLTKFSAFTCDMSGCGSNYTGGGLSFPLGIAIDGANNIWVANITGGFDAGGLSEFTNGGTAITGTTGFGSSVLNSPYYLAIDGSGNIWVTNNGNSSLVEFVGAAVPVVTPMVANLISPYAGANVNRP